MKNWLIENWAKVLIVISIALIVITLIVIVVKGLSSQEEIQSWFNKPLSNLKLSDIFILLIIHALISRSEHKCNSK